jgi:prepilin-type N-terminal cleavage/methylation domain-containing protein/prepilin-type processing-associated H-X9-DG protein
MRRAFTLIEILVVIGVLALLAALLFPVFAQARARTRQTACASNLRQLGQAMALYSSDFERFPRGLDPADKYTPQIWQFFPGGLQIMNETPLLPEVMKPYVNDQRLWQCAADTGFDVSDTTGLALDARPTCYAKFGMSYFYRTELMLREKAAEDLQFPAQTHVLADGAGAWHGSNWLNRSEGRRYNVLFADGHVKGLSNEDYMQIWNLSVQ